MILAGDYIPKGCRVDWRLPSGTVLCNLEAPVLGDAPERFRPSPKAGPNLYNVTLGNERRGGDAGGGANADVSSGIRPGNCGDRML